MKDLTEKELLQIRNLLRRNEDKKSNKLADRIEEHLNLEETIEVSGWCFTLKEDKGEIVMEAKNSVQMLLFSSGEVHEE